MQVQMDIHELARTLRARAPEDAAELLTRETPERIRAVLALLPVEHRQRVVERLPTAQQALAPAATVEDRAVPGSVSELAEPIPVTVRSGTTVAAAVEAMSRSEIPTDITYLYVTDEAEALIGLVVLRDLVLATADTTVDRIMMPDPFAFTVDTSLTDACQAAVHRHYPVYPVVDGERRLVGQVRGWRLFEQQVIEITAESGKMVGVNKEERVDTPFWSSFAKRHPWLQLNLLTAFIAAVVVGTFSGTIEKIVALAAFLPVLAGQSGNTGCQALAITLRGLALGDFEKRSRLRLVVKEAALGMGNGLLVGVVAAAAMWFYASRNAESAPQALSLALVIMLAMVGSCLMSGMSGVLIPLVLRRLGADPAVASAIFLTTITDIVGMGLMLGLATTLVL